MKSSMRIQVIERRSVLILAALLVVVAAFSLLTIGEMNAQSGPPEFLTAPELTAAAKEGNVIELSWTPVSGAVRYDLWVWPGSNWEQLDDGALTDTTYSHTGLIAGTTYYYTVRAVPASGIPGVWSEFVGAIAFETVPPTATPTSTATATSTSTVKPTATARPVPPGQGHAPSSPGYTYPGRGPSIYPDGSSTEPGSGMPPPGYSNPGSGPSPPGSTGTGGGPVPPGSTNPGDGPAPPGSTNPGSGPSPPGYTAVPTATPTYTPTPTATPTPTSSPSATATSTPTLTPTSELTATPTATAPALNALLLTAEATVRGIELSWDAAAGAVRYELSTWWDEEAGWQMIGGDKLAGTTYTHMEVAAGTTYYYSIRVVNAEGKASDWPLAYPSATALGVTGDDSSAPTPTPSPTATVSPPSVPPIPELTVRITEQGVELSWEAVAGAARYELATWWDLEIGWQLIGGDDLAGTTFMHVDVAAGTTYFYSIRAVNAEGEASDWLLAYPSATAK